MSMKIGVDRRVLSIVAAVVLAAWAGGLTVSSARAEGGCANEQLRAEQPYGLELPDCRAYEMVSPVDKTDGDATVGEGRAALSGDAVTYNSRSSFAQPVGNTYYNQYISRRESSSWTTQSITPRFSSFATMVFNPYERLIFTSDLSQGIALTDIPLTNDAQPGYSNFYVINTLDGSARLVTNGTPEEKPYAFRVQPFVEGASANLEDVVFQGDGGLYEWVNGELNSLAVAPNGEPMVEGVGLGNGSPSGGRTDVWRAVSTDGSRAFVTSGYFNSKDRQLYARENGTATIEVSASQRTDCVDHSPCNGTPELDPKGTQSAVYWGASADGAKVFFTSCAKLTDNATAVAPSIPSELPCRPEQAETGNDLYEYDLEDGSLRDLTVDRNAGDTNGAAVLGVAYVSEDGSYVYYVADGDLAEGASSAQPNLYVSHNGGPPRFIAALAAGEEIYGGRPGDREDWDLGPAHDTVAATADGTHFAFRSILRPTGYDNTDANTHEPDAEIFSYEANTGSLVCASCNPSGAQPVGAATFSNTNNRSEIYIPNRFSEDGRHLFFQSKDGLVVHDSNGREDVYDYEEGHIFPISDVAGNFDTSFLDASRNGNDVFISTADQLIPRDPDFRVDVYDAKVGGGFPVPVFSPPCENGDSCKGPVSPQPSVFGAPASATFAGVGNPMTIRPTVRAKPRPKLRGCTKGLSRKGHKCVRRRTRRSSDHSKNRGK
jgi:hypothetical protein